MSSAWIDVANVITSYLPIFLQKSLQLNELRGLLQFSSLQSLSLVLLFVAPWTAARQASMSITNLWSLLKLMFIELVMPSNHLNLSSPSPPDLNMFQHQPLFASSGQSIGASASISVLPMNIQGWFRLGFTGCISLQFKELLQHHSSKASILWCSAFFRVQLSHPYVTTGKTTALTRGTLASKLISLLPKTRPRFVTAFLPRSKCLLSIIII